MFSQCASQPLDLTPSLDLGFSDSLSSPSLDLGFSDSLSSPSLDLGFSDSFSFPMIREKFYGDLKFMSPPTQYIDTQSTNRLSTNQILIVILAIAAVYYFCNQKKSTFRIRRHY